jgi:hypothetical protein
LRFLIVYRTDGGKFARGLVRANGWLKRTHDGWLALNTPKGQKVRLAARLYRLRDPVAANRWVLAIEFAIPKEDIIQGDAEPVVASLSVSALSKKALMENMLHDMILFAQDSHRFPAPHGDHIRKMLDIADRLGYPKNYDLWFYTPPALWDYVKFETGDGARKRMTAATAGKFPFDGNTGYDSLNRDWRIYPFREAAKACMGIDREACRNTATNIFINADYQIHLTFRTIRQEKSRLSGVPTLYPGAWAGSPMVGAFFDHFEALGNDPTSLYSAF